MKTRHKSDPRTGETVQGIAVLRRYAGMFSENAPGWPAKLGKHDSLAGVARVTVAFGGKGADGAEPVYLHQYFVEINGGRISRMAGFVGTEEPS